MRPAVKPILAMVLAGVLASGISHAMTEEENQKIQEEMKDYKFKTVTTKEGLNFKIPEDLPIETRNGILAPIPFEEYLYFKLKKQEEKLVVIETKLNELLEIFTATRKKEAERERSLQEKAGLLSSS